MGGKRLNLLKEYSPLVVEYVNLSIYIRKTSKKVSSQKDFYGPVQGPSKLKKRKILGPQNLESFTLRFKFGTKMKS